MSFLLFQVQASPYLYLADDYLANGCSFFLLLAFLCCILFKIDALTENELVHARMSGEQQTDFLLPVDHIATILMVCVVGAVVFSVTILSLQLAAERRRHLREARYKKARRLRYAGDESEVHIPPPEDGQDYHLFLSHVWSTAQDQVRIIKQRLLEMMPALQVFLGA